MSRWLFLLLLILAASDSRAAAEPVAGLSPDGQFVIVGEDGGRLALHSADTGAERDRATTPIVEWKAIAVTPGGTHGFALGIDRKKAVKIVSWDRAAGSVRLIDAPFADSDKSFFQAPLATADGRRLIVRRESDEPGYLIDIAQGHILATVGRTEENPFSPDGRYLVSESENRRAIEIYDMVTGARLKRLETPSRFYTAQFLGDATIVALGIDCDILHHKFRARDSVDWVEIRGDIAGCSRSRFAEDGLHAIVRTSAGADRHNIEILALKTGERVDFTASSNGFAGSNVTMGQLLYEADGRPVRRALGGGDTGNLSVSRSAFGNDYRSRVVAAGRLLANFPGEPVRLIDLRSQTELVCIAGVISCEAGRARTAYQVAVRAGRVEDIVAILTHPETDGAALGPYWAESRLELASAYRALGRRVDARTVLERAVQTPDLVDRSAAVLALASMANEDGESVAALRLVETLIAELERAGGDVKATKATLVRASNGLRIALGASDVDELRAFLDRVGALANGSRSAGAPALDEGQYSELTRLSDVTRSSMMEAIGFGPDTAITRRRMTLIQRVGAAETLRAELLLHKSRGEESIDTALAALAAITRYSNLLDDDIFGFDLEKRVERLSLHSDILIRLADPQGAIGVRLNALSLLEKRDVPPPIQRSRINLALAKDRMAVGAIEDAEGNVTRAKESLLGKVPDDSIALLGVIGLDALNRLARQEEVAPIGAEIDKAILLGRRRLAMQRRQDDAAGYLELAALFEAGVDAKWYGSAARPLAKPTPVTAAGALMVPLRPFGSVTALRFSDNDGRLHSNSYGREIIWDVAREVAVSASKSEVGRQKTDETMVLGEGPRQARVGTGEIIVSDGDAGPERKIVVGEWISRAAASPDGKMIAVAGGESFKIRIYDVDSGTQLNELSGHSSKVRSLAWSSDAATLATGSDAGAIILYSVASGVVTSRLSGDVAANAHKAEIGTFAFSPDSRSLFTLSGATFEPDGMPLRQWDAVNGRAVAQYATDEDDALLISADGSLVGTLGFSQIDMFELSKPDAAMLSSEVPQGMRDVDTTIVTSRGAVISTEGYGRGTLALDIRTGAELWRQEKANGMRLAVNADGSVVAIADTRSLARLRLLSAADGRELCSAEVPPPHSPKGDVIADPLDALAFLPDGSQVAGIGMAMAEDVDSLPISRKISRISRWQVSDCAVVADTTDSAAVENLPAMKALFGGDPMIVDRAIGTADDPVTSVRFSPDGQRAYALTRQNKLWLWFIDAAQPPQHLATFAGKVSKLDFAPDGSRLAAASENGLWLWNARTGELIGEVGRK